MPKEKFLNFILNFIAIVSFIAMFFENLPNLIKNIFIVVGVICLLFLIYNSFNRSVLKRKKMIKKGNEILKNTSSKAVLFGGDLSWAEDYLSTLTDLLNDNKIVEIYFPQQKFYKASNRVAEDTIISRIDTLTSIGAKLYMLNNDYHIRCIISDPDIVANHEKTKVLFAHRIKKKENKEKNTYKVEKIDYEHNQQTCKMIITLYNVVKQESILF